MERWHDLSQHIQSYKIMRFDDMQIVGKLTSAAVDLLNCLRNKFEYS